MTAGWIWMVVIAALIVWAVQTVVTRPKGKCERYQPDEPGALAMPERCDACSDIQTEAVERVRRSLTPPGSKVA